jgi:hypothetical protein
MEARQKVTHLGLFLTRKLMYSILYLLDSYQVLQTVETIDI